MANKQIKDLPAAQDVNNEDVFMLQAPNNQTLKLNAQNLKGYMNAVDPGVEAQIYRMRALSKTFKAMARQPELMPFILNIASNMGPVAHLDNALVRTERNITIGKILVDVIARQPELFNEDLETLIIGLIGEKLKVFDINLEYSRNIVIGYLNEAGARQPELLGRMAEFVTRVTNWEFDYTPPVIVFNDSVVGGVLTINLADWDNAFTPEDFSGAAIAIITDNIDGIITTTPTVKFVDRNYTEVAEITPTTPDAPFTANISIADNHGNIAYEYVSIQLV